MACRAAAAALLLCSCGSTDIALYGESVEVTCEPQVSRGAPRGEVLAVGFVEHMHCNPWVIPVAADGCGAAYVAGDDCPDPAGRGRVPRLARLSSDMGVEWLWEHEEKDRAYTLGTAATPKRILRVGMTSSGAEYTDFIGESHELTPTGELSWSETLPASERASSVVISPRNEAYIFGDDGARTYTAQLYRFNPGRELAWTATPGPEEAGRTAASAVRIDLDQQLVAAGNHWPKFGTRPWIAKLDSTGNQIWLTLLPEVEDQFHVVHSLAILPDGGMAIGGGLLTEIRSIQPGESGAGRAVLVKVSAEGDEVWRWEASEPESSEVLLAARDGNIVSFGTYEMAPGDFRLVMRVNSPDGEVSWTHYYDEEDAIPAIGVPTFVSADWYDARTLLVGGPVSSAVSETRDVWVARIGY